MTALLEYLIWITRPRTIITERKKTAFQQSHQPRLSFLASSLAYTKTNLYYILLLISKTHWVNR